MNIGLIAGKSGDALFEELNKRGYTVYMVAGKESDPGVAYAHHKLVVDLNEQSEILGFFDRHQVKRVIIGTGHIKAIQLSSFLEHFGVTTSLMYEKSLLAKDKIKFKELLIHHKFSTPAFLQGKEKVCTKKVIERIGLPCVVKSAIDKVQPQKVHTEKALEKAVEEVLETNSAVLIEQFISGTDYTIAVTNDGSNIRALGAFNWNKAMENNLKGFNVRENPRVSVEMEAKIKAAAVSLVKELEILGLVRVDFVVTDEFFTVLELNTVVVTGNTGTVNPFYKAAGINIAKEMIDVSLNIIARKETKG